MWSFKTGRLSRQWSLKIDFTVVWVVLIMSDQYVPGFVIGYDHLEHAHTCTPLPFPVFRIGIQTLQDIKSLGSIVELPHLDVIINFQ